MKSGKEATPANGYDDEKFYRDRDPVSTVHLHSQVANGRVLRNPFGFCLQVQR